jgi:hypothetical protein
MASSSTAKEALPLAGKWNDSDLTLCRPNQVLCPVLRLKKTWETQVMFPYSLNGTVYAFGCPQPDENNRNKDTMDIFPIYKPCSPRVYINEPYNFSYIKNPNKVFRSAPYVTDAYKNWLARVHAIEIAFNSKTYSKYIAEHHGEGEVSDEEHVAFLALWLSQHVFCTKSLQVARSFIIMADQIHEGQQFGFSRLILGCLYESMRSACELMKKTGDGSVFLGYGPFWLLQPWLNATFPTELDVMLPQMHYEESGKRQIEGTRLALMMPRPRGFSYDQSFLFYLKAFLKLKDFKPSFAPFMDRPIGPQWFTHPLPP